MGDEKVLIAQKDKGKSKVQFKIRNKLKKGFVPNEYVKVVDPVNPIDLSLLFEDLNLLFNSPIEKAFFRYKQNKRQDFPF